MNNYEEQDMCFNTKCINKIIFILFSCLYFLRAFAIVDSLNLNDKYKVQKFLQKNNIPGIAIYIYNNGKEQQYVYGYSNLKNKTLVNVNTLFEVGSITKTFTGLLLAKLLVTNKIKLNDKISINNNPNFQNITLLDLATHSSGLPRDIVGVPYNATDNIQYRDRWIKFLTTGNLLYSPQKKFFYSNIGFSLLGKDLANREQKTYEQLIQENIFSVLKMDKTGFTVDKSDYNSYSDGYTVDNKLARTPDKGLLDAAWGAKSNIVNMQSYLKAMLLLDGTPNNLSQAIKIAQTPYIEFNTQAKYKHQIGLGWSITPFSDFNQQNLFMKYKAKIKTNSMISINNITNHQYNSRALIEKTGSTDGFRSYIGFIPNQKIGVVVLINKYTHNYGQLGDFGRSFILN
jgi:beta-lactamase class C